MSQVFGPVGIGFHDLAGAALLDLALGAALFRGNRSACQSPAERSGPTGEVPPASVAHCSQRSCKLCVEQKQLYNVI